MSNTIVTSNRTIEISSIDSDYTMDRLLNVESVVFIPGAANDVVDIIEVLGNAMGDVTDPVKVQLKSGLKFLSAHATSFSYSHFKPNNVR